MRSTMLKPSSDGLISTAVYFFCNRVWCCQLLEQNTRIRTAFFTYFVVSPFAFLTALNHARLNQNLHVVG